MADVQTQDTNTQSPTDIASLTGGGSKSAIADLVSAQKQKSAADLAITSKADKQLDADQSRVDAAYKAEGVAASEQLKPWDADKEHKRFEHDPIEGFGSVGGLFAMVASAFTKAPMENAINGMAGAINSIKAGDEASYERAHKSWQENTKLALERFKTQHELYQDAMGLMDHNAAVANVKLRNAAVRFGDSQTLMLAEHGMVKELFELQESRARAASQMQDMMARTTEKTLRDKAYEAGLHDIPDTGNPSVDAAHKLALYTRTLGLQKETPQQAILGQFFLENPKATAEEVAAFADKHSIIRQYGGTNGGSTETKIVAAEIKRRADSYIEGGMDPAAAFDKAMKEVKSASVKPTATKAPNESQLVAKEIQSRADSYIEGGMDPHEAFDKAAKEVKESTAKPSGPLSRPKAEQQEIERRTKTYEKENIDKGLDPEKAHIEAFTKAEREVASARATPSGNRIDDLRSKIDQTDNILNGAQKNLDFLKTFKGGAGLMGKLMRGEEIASNIVGAGTQSERVEFRRRVHELQEMVPRIITDSNGRPLKSAQEKVDDFVAGLNAGDTGPNTIRAYEELIAEMNKRQKDYRGRLEGGYDPNAKSSGQPAGTTSETPKADWLNAYPEKR